MFLDQVTNTEIHLLNDKAQHHQIRLEIEHLLEIFSRFGFKGESFEPASIHIATITLKLSDLKSFYEYKKPKSDFYVRFPNISLIDNTLCLTLAVDPTFAKYMVKLFDVDFGVHIPSLPIIKLKRIWNPLTFNDLDDFLCKYRPAMTDMGIPFGSLMLKNVGWVDRSFTLYPFDGTIFVLSETEIKIAQNIKEVTREDLIKIIDNNLELETGNKDDVAFHLGGATPHSLSISRAKVDDMEKMFDRFQLWYNQPARRLDFSDRASSQSNDSVKDIDQPNTKTETPRLVSFRSTCNSETQTPAINTSRLSAHATPWTRQNTQPPYPTESNNSKTQGKQDLLTLVAEVHRNAGSETSSVNDNLDLLTSDELSH